ncbi:CopD family protein [Pusillimonas sp. CC-YST705]|uniref:Protoporphyrinogen IX oxidase n=1 Tax=Mesopusillimonas faecipullorum TaxID=2755040 RepID=A0ABS8C925_9BURK|nr:CopD family protein [Mesopusillimonas faecipullorum]MCB5362518.1 CopD family protein [Mesopusillimonas faecipullorum]
MLWIKTFHLLFVISWFAGLFYLPRLYVNLAQAVPPETYTHLVGMARRLYRFMTILAVPAIVLGLTLWLHYGLGRGQGWMHAKLAVVLLLVLYHFCCGRMLHSFAEHRNTRSARFYRWFNEIPVILLLIVLILVVIRPF